MNGRQPDRVDAMTAHVELELAWVHFNIDMVRSEPVLMQHGGEGLCEVLAQYAHLLHAAHQTGMLA